MPLKFSIVIPSYNQGKFLEKTIYSIINQDYPNFEIIIIDGGSTDNTLSIIKTYEAYISYWVSEPDAGQANALNKGFRFAKGDIFAWQNSDDIYLPGAFSIAAKIFSMNYNIQVCYGNWYSIDENDIVLDVHYALKPRKPFSPYENIDAYNQCMFWRRGAHERFGLFDEALYQKMDTDMILRFLMKEGAASFYRTDAFLGAFRQHVRQKTDKNKMNHNVFFEEARIEKKMGFKSKRTLIGKYYRLRYRWAQFIESLYFGGPAYTLHRFIMEYKRRGSIF
jgi:glycosyltransferase involved in cell wall biosynthesis